MNSKKQAKRCVAGLREVARGLRANNIKVLFLATNLEDYEVIENKVGDLVALAHEKEVKVIRVHSTRKIGKALGKSTKISAVGIQNMDGGHEIFNELKKIRGLNAVNK